MFDIALAIFLLLSPIILSPNIENITALQFYQFGVIDSTNSMLQLQFFQFGIIALYLISLFQKKIREFNDKWAVVFIAGCLISVLLHPISVKIFPNIFLGFLLYKLIFEYVLRIRLLLFSIIIVSVLNFIFGILQLFGVFFIYHDNGSITGLMKSCSHLGTYQALAVPICYIFNPWLAIIPIIGLLLTKTWTAIFSVVLLIIYKFRIKILEILTGSVWLMLLISCIALFIVKYYRAILNEFYPRLWIWFETLKSLTFTGHGLGNFKIASPEKFFSSVYIGERFDNPYNVYLGIIYALGIFSIPIFIWLYEIMKIKNSKISPSCLILMVIALGQSFMDFPRLAGTVITLFSLLKIGDN